VNPSNQNIEHISEFLMLKRNKHLMLSNMANMNEKLYNWTFEFHKVVWHQIWGELVSFARTSSAVYH